MSNNADPGNMEFKLERYKFILQQLNSLNEHTHKYLTLFQTLVTAIVGGGIIVFISWKELKIDAAITKVALRGITVLLLILAVFITISIIAGVFSWIDYRREEVQLLNEIVNSSFRKLPNWRNAWRWYELYTVFLIAIVTIVLLVFIEIWVIPLIK